LSKINGVTPAVPIGLVNQPRFAGKLVINEADGNLRFGADAARGNALVAVLFQTAKRRFDEGFATNRRSCAAKSRRMPPIFLQVISSILIVPNPHPSDSFAKNI
jgi:hypothetical protein